MAIYHLHVKILQRSRGRNAVEAAAYRRAAKLYDEREEKYWDYTNKPNVRHVEMIAPRNAPSWVKELITTHQTDPIKAAQKLWNSVEASEKRKDSQLAREIVFALPLELSKDQNIELAREFIQDQFALRGMIADWSLHWDDGNPHVHVMLTMRELLPDGFGKRVLGWNSKILLQEWLEKWSEYANFHLRVHQHDVRIDHRSYKDQGIDLIPTVHQGKAVTDMDRRGIQTQIMKEANFIRKENLKRISADPKVLLRKVSHQSDHFSMKQLGHELGRYINDRGKFTYQNKDGLPENTAFQDLEKTDADLTPAMIGKILTSIEAHESVFTEVSLAKAMQPFTNNADEFAKAIFQIKASEEILYLGAGEDGRDRFTTKKMFEIENQIQLKADLMLAGTHVKISAKTIHEGLRQYQQELKVEKDRQLTDEQINGVEHILKSSSLSCLVGRAGTGKSFSLKAAKAIWELQGLRVTGIALSSIAANGLKTGAGIDSRTIESFKYAIKQGTLKLNPYDVVIMDEAGMTDSFSMLAVLEAVHEARAKLVLVGDHAQIQPVGPGASFRALIERSGFAEIQTVYRQEEQWQREATVAMSAGRIDEGLKAYADRNYLHFMPTEAEAKLALVDHWVNMRLLQEKNIKHFLVIAHRNKDVDELNTLMRKVRVQKGEIAEGYIVNNKEGEIKIAQGDRILFLQKENLLSIANGSFSTIKSVKFSESGKVINFTVILDDTGKEVQIDPSKFNHFKHGYAATVHKTQGVTADHTFVYSGGYYWNRHLTYVALSRHIHSCHLYASKETYQDKKTLYQQLGRLGRKDSVLDFPLAFAERRGLKTSGLVKLLPKYLAEGLKNWKQKLAERYQQFVDPEGYARKAHRLAQEKLENEKIQERREDARLVADYVDKNRDVGKAWQALQIKLGELGLSGMTYEKHDFDLISATKEYVNLRLASYQRNYLASQIMQEPSKYKNALQLYQIDLNKIQKEANKHSAKTDVEKPTFKSLLTSFVDMELEQTKMVHEMYAMRIKNPQATKELSKNTIMHANAINSFAKKAMKNPRIKFESEKLVNLKVESIAKRGGMSEIRERIKRGKWLKEDIQAIIRQMRIRAHDQSRSRSEDRIRSRSH